MCTPGVPTPGHAPTPAGCPASRLNSDTVSLEVAPDHTGRGLSSAGPWPLQVPFAGPGWPLCVSLTSRGLLLGSESVLEWLTELRNAGPCGRLITQGAEVTHAHVRDMQGPCPLSADPGSSWNRTQGCLRGFAPQDGSKSAALSHCTPSPPLLRRDGRGLGAPTL